VANALGAASPSSVVLCKSRQNVTRLVPHIAIKFRSAVVRSIPQHIYPYSTPGSLGVDQIWQQIDGWGLALEAVGARKFTSHPPFAL
jgi:hypothetical protein